MCGIAGLVSLTSERITEKALEQMGQSIEHRGRDAQGIHVRDNLGLVHRRLTLVDVSEAANQPLHDKAGNMTLVFNGEIVNFVELRNELTLAGLRFHTQSDTEVLLAAWRHWGPDCVSRFRGFFAFALVDWEQRALYLVRDRLGIKPLYFMNNGRFFGFSSEIKALFASSYFESKIDVFGLADYLAMQLYMPGRTLYQNVVSLLPGSILKVDLQSGHQSQSTYWSLPDDAEDDTLSYEETCEDIAEVIDESAALWTRADFPIGAFVSGGLDSSLVAAIAAAQPDEVSRNGARLQTFSSVFQNDTIRDERAESEAVADWIDSDHHPIELAMDEVVQDHIDLIRGLDMPIAGYSAPYRTMARHVRRSVKGALCGHGGDEFFCGYPKYLAGAFINEMGQALRGKTVDTSILEAIPYLGGFEEQVRRMMGRSMFKGMSHLRAQSLERSSFLINHLNPDLKRELGDYNPFEAAEELVNDYRGSEIRKLMRLDQLLLLPGLLHVEDRTSMMANLETRPVLLDHHVVERSAKIPTAYLMQNGLKSILRDVGKSKLPTSVTSNKRKSGVMYPVMACLEDPKLVHLRQEAMSALDRSEVFAKPAAVLQEEEPQFINQRVTWGLWSLGDCLSSFGC